MIAWFALSSAMDFCRERERGWGGERVLKRSRVFKSGQRSNLEEFEKMDLQECT